MILDGLLTFTGAGTAPYTDSPTIGTQDSTNIIDLGVVNGLPASGGGTSGSGGGGARDLGIGDDPALKLSVLVETAFTGGTSMYVELQGTQDNGSGSPYSSGWTVMWQSAVFTEATLIAGCQMANVDLPRNIFEQALTRYLKLTFVTVGTHSAGAVMGTIVIDRDDQIIGAAGAYSGYAAGINVAN